MLKLFTKLDLVRGYYQVPIDPDSRPITAFSTMNNHYQFKRLSFGLKNSGMAFQKTMQQILSPILTSNIIIYIDDVLIMSESFEDHIKLIEKVLSTLMRNGVKIKTSKCEWFKSEVTFLGHVINSSGIRKSPEYVEKVLRIEKPRTVKELRQFLGLINFQRKFIEKCSLLTKPLSLCTVGPKNKKICWNPEMEECFENLKKEVAKDVLLTYPDYTEGANKLKLFVDASSSGAGACLMQRKGSENKVIAYASMCFSETQKRYHTTDRELAAIRWGVLTFKPFLAGVPFILLTDHKPLIYLYSMSSTNTRLMRTLEELAEYEIEFRYQPGADNVAADYLSRLNDSETLENPEVDFKYIPKGLRKLCDVQGGGDSMIDSLLMTLRLAAENGESHVILPDTSKELRILLVNEVIKNLEEYGLSNSKSMRMRLRQMLLPGQQPIPEVLLAASKLLHVKILVYHGMPDPIVFLDSRIECDFTICLQCISLIHYNPLVDLRKSNTSLTNKKMVNIIEDVKGAEKSGFVFEHEDLEETSVDLM